eukprot:TRINITY_DN34573_c0_g1_i1.p1 TRINITY_DN34573_c0_g1~~TRINITY_DN34573_c0_g1_i1.p1  ORF type:complete len:891 (+),score=115.40 TRINITY_DN34573_c0_g1_i1:264-2675(+)
MTGGMSVINRIALHLRSCLPDTVWAHVLSNFLRQLGSRPFLQSHFTFARNFMNMSRDGLPWHDELFENCMLAPPTCWPSMKQGIIQPMASCLLCCSPHFGPEGFAECFDTHHNFAMCCLGGRVQPQGAPWSVPARVSLTPEVAVALTAASPKTSETVPAWHGPVSPVDWGKLRREVHRGCGGHNSAATALERLQLQAREINHWLNRTGFGDGLGGGQRIWPEASVYVALRVCSANDTWVSAVPVEGAVDWVFAVVGASVGGGAAVSAASENLTFTTDFTKCDGGSTQHGDTKDACAFGADGAKKLTNPDAANDDGTRGVGDSGEGRRMADKSRSGDGVADGPELLFRAGLLCPSGCCSSSNLSCVVEQRSKLGRFVATPCDGAIRSCDLHKDGDGQSNFAPIHAIEFGSLPIQSKHCPSTPLQGGVAILLGWGSVDNVGHALTEALFLAAVMRLTRLGAFGVGEHRRPLWIVPTLWRIWSCGNPIVRMHEGMHECSVRLSGEEPSGDNMQHVLYRAALQLLPNDMEPPRWTPLFSKEYPFYCPRCYDAVIQPTRVLVGDATLHNEYRRKALELCGVADIDDFPTRRRLVLLRRTRHSRSWGNFDDLLAVLLDWAAKNPSWDIEVVTLGGLAACEQLKALHDAAVAITVSSTEQFLASAFLPERAGLLLVNTLQRDSSNTNVDGEGFFETFRGPGMMRNASVSKKFRLHCSGVKKEVAATESMETAISSSAHTTQTASSRNLLLMSLNNVTCHKLHHRFDDSAPCHSHIDAVSADLPSLLGALNVAAEYVERWLPELTDAAKQS